MIAVAFVLDDELPVCLGAVTYKACRQFDFAFRRIVTQPVNGAGRIAQVFHKWHRAGRHATEYESAMTFNAWHRRQSKFRVVGIAVSGWKRAAQKRTVVCKLPRMVRTGKRAAASPIIDAQLVAAVRASVEQQANRTGGVPYHDKWLPAQRFAHPIVRLRNF